MPAISSHYPEKTRKHSRNQLAVTSHLFSTYSHLPRNYPTSFSQVTRIFLGGNAPNANRLL